MRHSHRLFLTTAILSALLSLAASQLYIQEAGLNGKIGPTLSETYTSFCPDTFSDRGFSVICTETPTSNSATFYFNGGFVRTESVAPYALYGDTNGDLNSWDDYLQLSEIRCEMDDGAVFVGRIRFECASPSPSPTPSVTPIPMAGDMLFVEAGLSGATGPILVDGLTFCPTMFPTGQFSIRCIESATSTSAQFYINGKKRTRDGKAPFYFKRDKRRTGFVNPWRKYPRKSFEITCELDDGITNSARVDIDCNADDVEETKPELPPGCIVIDAKDTITSPLPSGWTERPAGLAYKWFDPSTGIDDAGVSTLDFEFTVPITSRYGYVVDMTTRHDLDHNDIWSLMPGGFALYKDLKPNPAPARGYTKVYHNFNGRKQISSSVDHDPHTMSTYVELVEGSRVVTKIGGRSTRVLIHRIIMFPCSGAGCDRGDPTWNQKLAECISPDELD